MKKYYYKAGIENLVGAFATPAAGTDSPINFRLTSAKRDLLYPRSRKNLKDFSIPVNLLVSIIYRSHFEQFDLLFSFSFRKNEL